jgi:ETC complex I subunit conserved region
MLAASVRSAVIKQQQALRATKATTFVACRSLSTTPAKPPVPAPAAPAAAPAAAAAAKPEEGAISPVTLRRQQLRMNNPYQIMGPTGKDFFPAPILPEDPKEIAALDPADSAFRTKMDGTARTVVIRQLKKSARQAPLNPESVWKIHFYEDGMTTQKWTNPLMGWTSNSDPYQCAPPLTFPNAADAVYFAKKRGWNFVVKPPIRRYARRDDAQYQDNFLPQAVAAMVRQQGTACEQWSRESSMTSHYFRPLKYHGNGTVQQHGPNGNAEIAPHVPGCYKMR